MNKYRIFIRNHAPDLRCGIFTLACTVFLAFPWGNAEANSKYAAIVIDGNTGKTVFARSADRQRYPASLTKIMTLYMLFEHLEKGRTTLETPMPVSRHASRQAPSRLGLNPGETIRVEQAIQALVIKSANDAAAVIAEHIAGNEYKFAQAMTRKARALGMKRTRFMNASGLPHRRQVTTARDMAQLALRIREDFPSLYNYFSAQKFRWKGQKYSSHNKLLGRYRGTMGIKTGYTRASGFNLAAAVKRNGKYMVGIVLGGKSSESRNKHMISILDRSWPRVFAHAPKPRARPGKPSLFPNAENAPGGAPPLRSSSGLTALAEIPPPATPVRATRHIFATPATAAPAQPVPGAQPRQRPLFAADSWVIQIGAFTDPAEAVERIRTALTAAPYILSNAVPITTPLDTVSRVLYRSRFGGFDEATARKACGRLARFHIGCVAIPPHGWSTAMLGTGP